MVPWYYFLGTTAAGLSFVFLVLRPRLDALISRAASEFEAKVREACDKATSGTPLPIGRLWMESVVRVSSKRWIGGAYFYGGVLLLLTSLAGTVAVDMGFVPAIEAGLLTIEALFASIFWGAVASGIVVAFRSR